MMTAAQGFWLCCLSCGGLQATPMLPTALAAARPSAHPTAASQQVAAELLVHVTVHGFADGRNAQQRCRQRGHVGQQTPGAGPRQRPPDRLLPSDILGTGLPQQHDLQSCADAAR